MKPVNTTHTESDRLQELAQIRALWVDAFVQRRIDLCEGDCVPSETEAWENEGYARWRGYYPALNSLFPSHLVPDEVTA